MATTTATLSLSSADMTSDAVNINVSTQLYKKGTTIGLDGTTGLASKTTTADTIYTIFGEADYSDNKGLKMYIRNTASPNDSDEVGYTLLLTLGSQAVGYLGPGDWLFMPWDGTDDVKLTPSTAQSMKAEYMLVYEI